MCVRRACSRSPWMGQTQVMGRGSALNKVLSVPCSECIYKVHASSLDTPWRGGALVVPPKEEPSPEAVSHMMCSMTADADADESQHPWCHAMIQRRSVSFFPHVPPPWLGVRQHQKMMMVHVVFSCNACAGRLMISTHTKDNNNNNNNFQRTYRTPRQM